MSNKAGISSAVVTRYVQPALNTQKLCILPTQCIYVLYDRQSGLISSVNSRKWFVVVHSRKWLAVVLYGQCVICAVRSVCVLFVRPSCSIWPCHSSGTYSLALQSWFKPRLVNVCL
jgi:hypothetical protein